jgi:4'-phosphopantetheinyl transferase
VTPLLAPPAPGEVHVWAVRVPEAEAGGVGAHLAAEERARAARFKVAAPRRRYVAARGLLRRLLGSYLGEPAERIAIAAGRNGKPELPGTPLHFSVSHSGERVLLAFARDRPLGADVEEIRAAPDLLDLARRFFALAEAEALGALPEPERAAAFFSLWTRKEACLKVDGEGVGAGLARPPASFGWVRVREIDVGAGYCAAVAAPGQDWRPLRFDRVPG